MVELGERGATGDRGVAGERGPKGDHGQHGSQGARGARGPANRLAVVGYIILTLAVAYAISINRDDINQVCATVQSQLDRNAATVERGLNGLKLIRDNPSEARLRNVPGFDYYIRRPHELKAAIDRAEDELMTYKTNAC